MLAAAFYSDWFYDKPFGCCVIFSVISVICRLPLSLISAKVRLSLIKAGPWRGEQTGVVKLGSAKLWARCLSGVRSMQVPLLDPVLPS